MQCGCGPDRDLFSFPEVAILFIPIAAMFFPYLFLYWIYSHPQSSAAHSGQMPFLHHLNVGIILLTFQAIQKQLNLYVDRRYVIGEQR